MTLVEAMRLRGRRIADELEESKLYRHMGDRGRFREDVIRDFLRPFLPPAYGLSSGEVFAHNGEQSAQVDIVIYDAVFSTVLFRDRSDQLFPAESVFGSIEVKSHLSVGELEVACANIRSVKSLQRSSSDSLDFLPTVRLELGRGLGLDGASNPSNPYLGFVWAFDGCSREAAVEVLGQKLATATTSAERQLLPDGVFVWKKGYLIIRGKTDPVSGIHWRTGPGREFSHYMHLAVGNDVLPLFFLMVTTFLGLVRLKAPNLDEQFDTVFRSYVGRERSSS